MTNTIGLGFRNSFAKEFIELKPKLAFIEVHSENYFGYCKNREQLLDLATDYNINLHGIGLSLASVEGISKQHLTNIVNLANQIQPQIISEHLAWCQVDNNFSPDLLPIPYNQQSLDTICRNIDIVQQALGRSIVIENPANYLAFAESTMSEAEWILQILEKTGSKLLLDINNVFISAYNLGFEPLGYLQQLDSAIIGQYHLGGHSRRVIDNNQVLIDSHDATVAEPVLKLYQNCLSLFGDKYCTLERDSNIPKLAVLLSELHKITNLPKLAPKTIAKQWHCSQKNIGSYNLKTWQQQFYKALINVADSSFSTANNKDIYRNNYYRNISDYLQSVYIAVNSLIGDKMFLQFCNKYATAFKPQSANIFEYGSKLYQLLATIKNHTPYIVDIAKLEWYVHQVFFAQQTRFIGESTTNTSIADTCLEATDSFYLLSSDFPLLTIKHQAIAKKHSKITLDTSSRHFYVIFKDIADEIVTAEITAASHSIFEQLQAGTTLNTAMLAIADNYSQQQLATAVVDCCVLLKYQPKLIAVKPLHTC